MTRAQFLNDMYRRLCGNGMDRDQAEQHLTYYAEMLADRMEEGMTEDEAVASMEDLDTIARRILEEEGLPYRPPEAIAPPAYPDVSPSGGGTRAYQTPKKWSGRKIAQVALWALAVAIALGAASRWLWTRNARSHAHVVDSSSSAPVEEVAAPEAPYADWYYDEGYAWEAAYASGYEYSSGTTSYFISSLKKLDIEWASGTVSVQSWGGEEIQIQEYSHSELTARNSMVVTDEGDELTIRYRDGTSLGNVKGDKWLAVLLPDGMLEELEIETTSANVQLLGLEQGEIGVSTASGNVTVSGCYALKAEIETISGEIDISGLYADELDASSTSGYIYGDVNCGDIEISTTSGRVSLYTNGGEEHVSLNTISGDIWLSVSSAAIRSIDVETVSGYVSMGLPFEMGFTLEYSTISGGIGSSFDMVQQDGKIIYNGGGCEIEVETVSGDLEIY
ncbi:MAG: DUF4097 family beta strand repeat-containing protein [Oscillospiraceae bacterium]|nr:DUF4097 family beta strand repeat-containing protein [Oscillospiraceae bacterium]